MKRPPRSLLSLPPESANSNAPTGESIVRVPAHEVHALVRTSLERAGVPVEHAALLAQTIVQAEMDATPSHGLLRLPGYLSSLNSTWVNCRPSPRVQDAAPGLVCVDADNGYAQIGLAAGRTLLCEKAHTQGIAALAMRNSHHFASLYLDVEPFAREGFIALTFVNTRSLVVGAPGARTVLGTNPMAFACPRRQSPPMVWDQASSQISRGDTLLHAQAGKPLPEGVGVDAQGQVTTDPRAVLDGGAFLTFGGHKGFVIAMMVEVLAAAWTGGSFGFEHDASGHSGAQTTRGGQTVILLKPQALSGTHYDERIEALFAELCAQDGSRLPGDRRYRAREQAEKQGLSLSAAAYRELRDLASSHA